MGTLAALRDGGYNEGNILGKYPVIELANLRTTENEGRFGNDGKNKRERISDPDIFHEFYTLYKRGAAGRAASSVIMWLCAMAAYMAGIFTRIQFIGISFSVVFLVLISLPGIVIAARLRNRNAFLIFSIFSNETEIIGYTAIIYFVGGLNDAWLTLMYGALIAFHGIASSRRLPWIAACCCAVTFAAMVVFEHYGLLPGMAPLRQGIPAPQVPAANKIMITVSVIFLLFVVAGISSQAAGQIRRVQNRLRKDKRELEQRVRERTIELEKHRQHLENIVDERTRDLMTVNEQLRKEVSERKETEEKLKKSEEQYRLLAENVTDVIWIMDLDLCYKYVSPAVERLWGYPVREIMAQRIDYLLPPTSKEKAIRALDDGREWSKTASREEKENRVFSLELEVRRNDGSTVWTETNVRFLVDMDERPIGLIGATRDISDRKQAEEALRESEERYSALFERSLEAVFIHDFEGNFLDANQVALDLVGYEKADIRSLNFASLLDMDQLSLAFQKILEIIDTGFQQELAEFRLTRHDGRKIVLESKGSLIYRGGEPYAIQGLARDITERVMAEAELRAREEEYRHLFQNLRVGVVVHGPDGAVMNCNPEALRILGLTEDRMRGKTVFDIGWTFLCSDGSDMPVEEYPINRVIAAGEPIKPYVVGMNYGSKPGWTLVNAYPVYSSDNILKQVVVTFVDITEGEEAKKALKESEARYRLLAENVEDVIYTLGPDLLFTYITPSITKLIGYTPDELRGAHLYDILSPESKKSAEAETTRIIERLEKNGFKPFELPVLEFQVVCKDGSFKWVEVQRNFFTDEQGTPMGMVGVTRDITRRRNAVDRLNQAYSELKLAQAQLVQSAKLASIGELAAGVAHELNQPLMVIRTTAQFIQRMLSQNNMNRKDILDNIETTIKNTKRMMNIINHLRSFSHQSTDAFTPVDINRTIEDCFLMVEQQIRLRNIEIRMHLQPDLPQVDGRASQLEQVFLNLISNARDAIELKREKGSAGPEEDRSALDYLEIITRAVDGDENQVEVLFVDNGIGIEKAHLGNIFDPFFTTKEVGKGTGLGLAISYGIIKDHRGEIEVTETVPTGAAFKITLPLSQT